MAYVNINNLCMFEGRLTKDPEYSKVGNGISKVTFSIAVDRNLSKEQKEKAISEGKETADFINFDCLGPKADFISNYFKKGSAIKVVSSFRQYSYVDSNGAKKYGYSFDVVDAGFTVGGNSNSNSGGGTPQPPTQPKFTPIDDNDIPF